MWTHQFIFLLGLKLCLFLGTGARAAELTLKVVEKTPPPELSAEIRSTLQPKAVQLLEGDAPLWEFWFRSEVPLSAEPTSPDKALDLINQPELIGAVRVSKDQRDYRDDELLAGVYTIRFGLQPQDGNHLGSSDFLYFAVLIPAKHDSKPDGIATYKSMTKASSRDTSAEHPLILSVRPVKEAGGALPRITEPAAEHKSARIQLPAKAGNKTVPLIMDLVFEGKAKE